MDANARYASLQRCPWIVYLEQVTRFLDFAKEQLVECVSS